jgi:hypothetical protein
MTKYTVSAVHPDTKSYEGKYGTMVTYKVKFAEDADTIEISRKPSSPAPKVGDELEGVVNTTDYGKKFKQDFTQGQGGGGRPAFAGGGSGGKFSSDPYTMYLSYAKDIAVIPQMFAFDGTFNTELYAEVLDAVETGGKTLYNNRLGHEEKAEPKAKAEELATSTTDIDKLFEEANPEKPVDWDH